MFLFSWLPAHLALLLTSPASLSAQLALLPLATGLTLNPLLAAWQSKVSEVTQSSLMTGLWQEVQTAGWRLVGRRPGRPVLAPVAVAAIPVPPATVDPEASEEW